MLLGALTRPFGLLLVGMSLLLALVVVPIVLRAPPPIPPGTPSSLKRLAGVPDPNRAEQDQVALGTVVLAACCSGWASVLFRCVAMVLVAPHPGGVFPFFAFWFGWQFFVLLGMAALAGLAQVPFLVDY